MPILNYTTTVEATKTIGQIQLILAKHGARQVLTEYDEEGHVSGLSFQIMTPDGLMGVRLPVRPGAILRILEEDRRVPQARCNYAQAVRVAWRIVKSWVEAQMAIIETEMVSMQEVFLPYVLMKDGATVYETMIENNALMLEAPKEE